MTALILNCPHCKHSEPLALDLEDNFMSLGEKMGPNTYSMNPEKEMSAFEAAKLGWAGFGIANHTIEQLAAEYDRVVSQLDVLSKAVHSDGPFVASANRRLFHRPECTWAQCFLDKRSCEVFDTHEDAVVAGKRPCRTCCA